jgi:hypothetical protein
MPAELWISREEFERDPAAALSKCAPDDDI